MFHQHKTLVLATITQMEPPESEIENWNLEYFLPIVQVFAFPTLQFTSSLIRRFIASRFEIDRQIERNIIQNWDYLYNMQ